MNAQAWIALAAVLLPAIIAHAGGVWYIVKLLIRSELSASQNSLLERLDGAFVRKETQTENDRRFARLEKRVFPAVPIR